MKKIRLFISSFLMLLAVCACHEKKHGPGFSYHPSGYYYQLISFDSDSATYRPGKVSWVAAYFENQSDSVFWDSYNNLNDNFYIKNDSTEHNFFKNYISKCTSLDSGCVLVKTKDFFQQQFKSDTIPFFSRADSVVRIHFKVKHVYEKQEYAEIQEDLREKEQEKIKKYFGTRAEMQAAEDPLGFYWIEHNEFAEGNVPEYGDLISVSYKGEFLNGRFLERSGVDFECVYGTPDQLLPGLNYVISRLKKGENAKIILPSRLAFGENGSSNTTVPPFTPLVYEIKLITLKTAEPAHTSKPAVSKKLKHKKHK